MNGVKVTAGTAIAFVAALVVGFVLVSQVPAYDRPDEAWVAWAESSSDRTRSVVGTMLWCAAGLLLMTTWLGLARVVRADRDDDHLALDVARGAGVVSATAMISAALIAGAVPAAMTFAPDFSAPGGDVIRMLDQLGLALLLVGCGWSSAVALACISWSAGRTSALPLWLTRCGQIASVALVLSPLFVPIVVLPLWMAAAGIVLARGSAPRRA